MKVKELVKKINYASSKLPVYMQEGLMGEPKKVVSFDFAGYPFEEAEKTVMSISLGENKVTIYYK